MTPDEHCKVCGRQIIVMCFRGSGACCGNCQKVLASRTSKEKPENR